MDDTLPAFFRLWCAVTASRVGYLWLVWFIVPKVLPYICWVEGPLGLLLFVVAPESFLLAERTAPEDVEHHQAAAWLRRVSAVLVVTSLPVSGLLFVYQRLV